MKKKTILITGASSGFGKATAKFFYERGWNVVATMRHPEKEQELNLGESISIVKLDVQDKASISQAIEEALQKFGSIDVLVNNAGYGLMGVFESATEEQIRRQFDVNVFGLMNVTQAVIPIMRSQQSGVIINISSFGGVVALPFTSLYASSKFAVEGFSEALSHELIKFNIRVKLIEPGGVHTNFRTGLELIKNDIATYNELISGFFARYGKPTEHLEKAVAEDVATGIYKAATEETDQLRYVIGNDAVFLINLKNQQPEEQFIRSVRDYFVN